MLSQQTARTLAHLISQLRDDWNEDGIYTALGRCRDRESYAVCLAALRAARDPGARTPGVIPTDGPHWRELDGKPVSTWQRPPRRDEECPLHPGNWRDTCHACVSDRLAGERTLPPELRRPDRESHLARVRAELAVAQTARCPHGVAPERCADHRPNPSAEHPAGESEETS